MTHGVGIFVAADSFFARIAELRMSTG